MSQTPSPNSQDDADLEGAVILVVDDNEQNVELLEAYLESMPVKVLTASDGEQALAVLADESSPKPDLVLLDIMMPRMSGFEVCRKIKQDDATRDIPVMMVTALNELGDIERGVEAGTDEFLSKPVNKLELLTRVRSLLKSHRLHQQGDSKDAYIRDLERMLDQAKRPSAG